MSPSTTIVRETINGVFWCVLLVVLEFPTGTGSCPTSICSCSARGVVVCSKKRLERIPFFSTHPDEVRRVYDEIDLSRNEIFAVPPYAFDSVRTRSLLLDRNPLIGISPRAFAGLDDVLQRLDLSNCDLRVVHWAVFRHLRQLRDVNLARNALFAIPRGLFDGLDNIQNISLANNRLAVIRPSLLRGLRNLRQLDLSGNAIVTIEAASFEDCRQMTKLNLANNRLRQLNVQSLRGLENVQRLSLDGNELVGEIPAEVFFALRSLRFLYLSHNNMTSVGARQFSASPRLEEITLSSNLIDTVATDAFYGLTRLRSVRFDDNRLSTIDGCFVAGLLQLDTLVELGLVGNPLQCTCDRMWWLHAVTSSKTMTSKVTLTGDCRGGPEAIRGMTLLQFYNGTTCSGRGGAMTSYQPQQQQQDYAAHCTGI